MTYTLNNQNTLRTSILSLVSLFLLLVMGSCNKTANNTVPDTHDLTQWVNPMIGTDFTGNTYPGAQVPFGMVQLSPDNGLPGWDRISGYFYPDSTIAGFSHTHLSGTGAGDLYDISFMPVMRPLQVGPEPLGVFSYFSHQREIAKAGYYKVHLDSYDIDVELTATPRCGIQRYTFPQGDAAVILNLNKAMNWDRTTDSHIEILDSVTIAGYRYSDGWARNQKVYFASRFSKPFATASFERHAIDNGNNNPGSGVVATFDYTTTKDDQLVIVTALSGVSVEGALANLAAEGLSNDFDAYHVQATASWNQELEKITIKPDKHLTSSEQDDQLTIFYTAMYHSMLAPTIFGDVTGQYLGPDGTVHQVNGWTNYSSFSLWDTYRASHPLFTILTPDRATDMARSLIEFGNQLGRLPVWNMWASETDMMIGYHSAPVIIDAILKGLGQDGVLSKAQAEEALKVAVATARNGQYRQLDDYMQLGYVPSGNHDWSMSKTLEYAYDDWCIAQLAQYLGQPEIYDEFMARASNYLNTFNPATGFFQPRDPSGNYSTDFVPEAYDEEICESNAWQYLFSVQHDIPGLMQAMGGKETFEATLDSLFTRQNPDIELPIFSTGMIGQYAHGNEPGHHVPYLYNFTDHPEKGAQRLRQIMNTLYSNTPDGICGNDDMGQMSAWYVFSALGFYPLNPVGGQYQLGMPLFHKAKIKVGDDKYFKIEADGLSKPDCKLEAVYLNGEKLNRTFITHQEIMNGGKLEFEFD